MLPAKKLVALASLAILVITGYGICNAHASARQDPDCDRCSLESANHSAEGPGQDDRSAPPHHCQTHPCSAHFSVVSGVSPDVSLHLIAVVPYPSSSHLIFSITSRLDRPPRS